MRIIGSTKFNCSVTGVTGHFYADKLPFTDLTNIIIKSEEQWNKQRNQQRNWETIQQVIGLRTQANYLSLPFLKDNKWWFEFEVEHEDVFGSNFSELYKDCSGVPMIVGLGESKDTIPQLTVIGQKKNIWFQMVNTTL